MDASRPASARRVYANLEKRLVAVRKLNDELRTQLEGTLGEGLTRQESIRQQSEYLILSAGQTIRDARETCDASQRLMRAINVRRDPLGPAK
jgi:hypothetical protein